MHINIRTDWIFIIESKLHDKNVKILWCIELYGVFFFI